VTLSRLFPNRWSRALGAATVVLALSGGVPVLAVAPDARPVSAHAGRLAPRPQTGEGAAEANGESEAGGGWKGDLARAFNFAILVGGLWYLLRTPVAGYLRSRDDTIRRDLVEAANLRASAEQQLAEVRARLAGLPAELETLRRRGEEELAAERVRMQQASAGAREALLERTRRDIDLQFRLARRELMTHTAELAMRLARTRLERTITPDDQARLVDRYAAEVRA
jgi:F-type H+-transporting ATPase subunit b